MILVKEIWNRIKRKIKPYLHWKMLLVFGSVWVLTNGIWYVLAFTPIGIPEWIRWFARGYIAFLYMPFTAEKVVIAYVSTRIYKKLFKEEIKSEENL